MTPTKEGFFWAMLMRPTGFPSNECADDWKSVYFEPVEVFDNNGAPGSGEELMVFCLGRNKAQRIDAFDWGDEIPFPAHYEQRDTMADRELIRGLFVPKELDDMLDRAVIEEQIANPTGRKGTFKL